ncbi:MAG TPA: rod shape-determining protein RodA [Bacteroidetes bacterium]|nr:rod shape-determining protein RodA [Bacteroidota bacterium]
MRPRTNSTKIDYVIFSIYLALVAIGWAMIYTVGSGQGTYHEGFFNFLRTPVGRQLIWVAIAMGVFVITLAIDPKFWRTFSNPVYLLSILVLLGVLVFGKTIKGATSWFDFGSGITLQPSEFAKFGTSVALAGFLSSYTNNLRSFRSTFYAILIFAVPAFLILMQPDAGSALVFLSFFIVLYREGFPGWVFGVGFILIVVFVLGLVHSPWAIAALLAFLGFLLLVFYQKNNQGYWIAGLAVLVLTSMVGIARGQLKYVVMANSALLVLTLIGLWLRQKHQQLYLSVLVAFLVCTSLAFAANYTFEQVLKPHQKERIGVWLKPDEADLKDAAYNLNNSKMAIGAGGLLGKGFLEGRITQGNFVPEQITDFIFSAVGEEQGFLGVVIILALFFGLLARIVFIAERQRTVFNRVYAYGVASVLFIHIFINIGMTMGLLPIIGIPLPFLSKGGSSLLGFTLMIAVLLKLDAERGRS